jgi:hypothetical protein
MVFQSRILTVGTLVAAATALYDNLQEFLRLPNYPSVEPITFAVFILALGYVAAEKVFADERRLLSIENELAIAREIQRSIPPSSVPEVDNLLIAAAYRPMTAVACYPVCELPLNSGDRFLLYTDGVTEPENALGVSFGDSKLEQVIRNNQSRPSAEFSAQLLSEATICFENARHSERSEESRPGSILRDRGWGQSEIPRFARNDSLVSWFLGARQATGMSDCFEGL